jgi:DDE superfamily endonuclease
MPGVRVGRGFFSRRQRKQIERLALTAPAKLGWQLTHWSQRSLAQAAVEQEYVESVHPTTIGALLKEADLHPQHMRWWKNTVWDDEAVERCLRILWYYERIESFWQQGELLLALDEKPGLQVLERALPTQPMRPGQAERQEFTYIRHGTLNLLASLNLHNGHMSAECLEKNDGPHFRPALGRLLHPYSWVRRIHLIIDNGPSHISAETTDFFERLSPRIHVLLTPFNASWLNQAEALLEAFSQRYLIRGSWCSRSAMIQHIMDSTQEFDQCFARPFAWKWSCRDFLYWLNNTPGLLRCRTYPSDH